MTIPNALTLFRIISTPVAIYLFITENFSASFLVFTLAALSDFFDGRLARMLDQCTDLGALLDPVADKVFEMSFILVLAYAGELPWFYAVLLNFRNFCQLMSIPILMWWKKINFKVDPSWMAKWGSALGMFVIGGVIFLKLVELEQLMYLLYGLIALSAAFEVYMLVTYVPRFVQIYQGKHNTFN
jgi:cardiolipin synthase